MTKKAKIQRDDNLIGDFYIEGAYQTREDAIAAQIITRPDKTEFKPCFVDKTAYLPLLILEK